MKIMISVFLLLGVCLPALAAEDEQSFIGDKDCRVFNPHPKDGERITWSGACKDGFADGAGVLQWYLNDKPGTKVEGELKQGKLNGKETQTFATGAKLVANFEDDHPVGDVDYTAVNGAQYHGPWKNGPEGKGVMTFADGARYEGDFVGGKRTGKGTYEAKSGKRYEGDFVDGKMTGKGVITWPDGSRFTGDVSDGQPNGKGALKLASGDNYEGDFVNGKRTGKGIYAWTSGDRYEGDFIDGKLEGKGVTAFANGNRYEGSYAKGLFSGEGKMQYAAGNRYEGSWKDGKYEGKGTLTSADGKSVAGDFSHGEKITSPAKVVQTNQVEKGRLQICANADSQKEIEIPADGKFVVPPGKAGLQEPVVVTQTDFSSTFDAASQAQNNSALHDQFKLDNRDGKLWVHFDTKGASCIYLNAEAPMLSRSDVTISGSHAAPDWVPGADGANVKGVSYRYFNSVDQTYYVASEVGKSLSFAVHEMQTGSNLNHDRVQRVPVTNTKVLALVPNAFRSNLAHFNQYDTDLIDLEKYNINAQKLDVQNSADLSAMVAQFTKAVHPQPHSRLILALPIKGQVHLKFSNTTRDGGKIEGLGFYRESGLHVAFDTDRDDYVPIEAFVHFQAAVIDIDSAKLVAVQSYADGRMFSRPPVPEIDLADTISDGNKYLALFTAVNEGVAKVMGDMFVMSLGR